MTAGADAQAHLSKAREFLEASEANRDRGRYNAAASDAVISGINSKDAICLILTGRTNKSDRHGQAVSELKSAGPAGAAMASALGRLLRLKTKSQYQAESMVAGDATKATVWAARLLAGAEQVVSDR